MADTIEKEVKIDIEVKTSQAIKNLAALKKEIADNKAAQKALDLTTEEGREEYEKLGIEINKLNATYRVQQKELYNAIKADKAKEGSMVRLKAELSKLKMAYEQLSESEREDAAGIEMQEKIKDISDQLKEAEASIGVFNRSVGDYENAINNALQANTGLFGSIINLSQSTGGLSGGLKAAGTAVKGFGMELLKLLANPVVAIVGAIALAFMALYAIFNKMITVIRGNEEQSNKLEKVLQPLRLIGDLLTQVFEKLADVFLNVAGAIMTGVMAIMELIGVTNTLNETTADYIALETQRQQLVKDQRTLNESVAQGERDIAELRAKATEKEKYSVNERIGFIKQAIQIEKANLVEKMRIAQEELRIQEALSARTKDSTEEQNKLSEAKIKLFNIEKEFNETMRSLNKEQNRFLKEEKAAQEERARAYQENVKKKREALKAIIEIDKELAISSLKAEKDYQSEDFLLKQQYNDKIFKIEQDAAKKIIELQKFKAGTAAYIEQQKQLQLLKNKETEYFNNKDLEMANYRKSIFDQIEKDEQQQINETKANYTKLLAQLDALPKPTFANEEEEKQYELNITKTKIQLAKQLEDELTSIKENSLKTQIDKIDSALSFMYGEDLKKFTDNELEKTKVLIEQSEKRIEELKKAGQSTAEEEANLRALKQKEIQLNLANELTKENQTAQDKYNIKKTALEAELLLYKDNATKQAEINEQLKQLDADLTAQKIENAEMYAGKSMEALTAFNELFNALGEKELQDYETKNEEKKASLDNQLQQGLISQQEYDNQVAAMDKDLDKKKAKIAREQAAREKVLKAFDIIINTAANIVKAGINLPLQILMGITGAAQLAAVMAAPLPKAARGKYIQGNSHAQGGTMIEAEGGEVIINKASTAQYLPLLSAINVAGGGVPFGNFTDGGFAMRNDKGSVLDTTTLERAIKDMQIVVSVEDINRGQKNYANVIDRASF